MIEKAVILIYGLFLIVGAFMGWAAGSKISLIMGLVSGFAIWLGYPILQNNPKGGLLYLSIVSGILVIVFLKRFLKTSQFIPSGLLLLVTIIFAVFCLFHYFRK